MKILIIICSKFPNPYLYESINKLYNIQIKNNSDYKICIVDSDSNDITNYTKIQNKFPEVDICLCKNINYEYGAWKYGYTKYPDYDIYICLQDTTIIYKQIDISKVNDQTVYNFINISGFYSHPNIKELGIRMLKDSPLDYPKIIDTRFMLSQHNIFVVNNNIMKDIFDNLTIAPIDKNGSCSYERLFGIYFILKNINCIPLGNYINKVHGKRI